MAYDKSGYYKRAKAIQEITAQQYRSGGCPDRDHRWVWYHHVEPLFGIGYATYMRYQTEIVPTNYK